MVEGYKFTIVPVWANQDYYTNDLAKNMRQQDLDELHALGVKDIAEEIRKSVMASDEAFAAYDDSGRVIVMYGVVNKEPGGMVWCLGSDLFPRFKKSFVSGCMMVFRRWIKKYSLLWNFVSKENTLSIRWLGMFKARFEPYYMVNGNEFWKFEIGGEEYV